MSNQLFLEISTWLTVLTVVAMVISFLGACGVFRSRRHRELDARLKQALYQNPGSQTQSKSR